MRIRTVTWAVCSGLVSTASASPTMEPPLTPLHVSALLPPGAGPGGGSGNFTDSCCTASAHFQELMSLSELPLDRLLRVRVAMEPMTEAQERAGQPADENGETLPRAEALRGQSHPRGRTRIPPMPRGDVLDSGSGSLGTKQSKLATGFQLAITVLSFLAFGAYLISLVVSIVRNNSVSTTTNTTQQPFVLVPAQAGKKRRRRRAEPPPWIPPPLPEPDKVFDTITAIAKAYATFEGHKLDQ